MEDAKKNSSILKITYTDIQQLKNSIFKARKIRKWIRESQTTSCERETRDPNDLFLLPSLP